MSPVATFVGGGVDSTISFSASIGDVGGGAHGFWSDPPEPEVDPSEPETDPPSTMLHPAISGQSQIDLASFQWSPGAQPRSSYFKTRMKKKIRFVGKSQSFD